MRARAGVGDAGHAIDAATHGLRLPHVPHCRLLRRMWRSWWRPAAAAARRAAWWYQTQRSRRLPRQAPRRRTLRLAAGGRQRRRRRRRKRRTRRWGRRRAAVVTTRMLCRRPPSRKPRSGVRGCQPWMARGLGRARAGMAAPGLRRARRVPHAPAACRTRLRASVANRPTLPSRVCLALRARPAGAKATAAGVELHIEWADGTKEVVLSSRWARRAVAERQRGKGTAAAWCCPSGARRGSAGSCGSVARRCTHPAVQDA